MSCSTNKLWGELAEIRFLLKAASQKLVVCRPWGETHPYDFVVGNGKRFYRVQVRSTRVREGRGRRGFHIDCGRGGNVQPCTGEDYDFIAAHVIPKRAWYIIPVAAFAPCMTVRLYPDLPANSRRFEQYREAWHLLKK